METLWVRMCAYAVKRGLSYGIGIDSTSGSVIAHVGRAMGQGPTSNDAINRCADNLATLEGWEDDRG